MEYQSLLCSDDGRRYLIATGRSRNNQPCVVVALFDDCANMEKTKPYFHAALLGRAIEGVKRQRQEAVAVVSNNKAMTPLTDAELRVAEEVALADVPAAWDAFSNKCVAAGWDLTKSEVPGQGYEIVFR